MVVVLQFLDVLLGGIVQMGGPQKQTLPDRFVAYPNPSQIPGVDYALEQTHILIISQSPQRYEKWLLVLLFLKKKL